MVTLFQVDKSGNDIFEKDYSIALVLNKKVIYGINIPQSIKDNILYLFKRGKLNINSHSEKQKKNRFRIRFHTAVIIKLIEKAIKDIREVREINIELCNDIDGHFHEIKDMIFKHVVKLIPSLKPEDIVLTKFQKPSLVDDAGKIFRIKDREKMRDFHVLKLNLDELVKVVKK